MKNILFIGLFLLALFSCGGNTKPKPPMNGVVYEGDSVNFTKFTYKEGVIISEQPFVNNKAHGLAKDFYTNGNLRLTVEYKDAKRGGMSVLYYETGEKHSEVPYKDGKINGIKYIYDKDGAIIVKAPYEDGEPIPSLEEFDAKGEPINQPTIKLTKSGSALNLELSDKSFTEAKFYLITGDNMSEIPTTKGVGVISIPKKGMAIRAHYKTLRGVDGAVDAKY